MGGTSWLASPVCPRSPALGFQATMHGFFFSTRLLLGGSRVLMLSKQAFRRPSCLPVHFIPPCTKETALFLVRKVRALLGLPAHFAVGTRAWWKDATTPGWQGLMRAYSAQGLCTWVARGHRVLCTSCVLRVHGSRRM